MYVRKLERNRIGLIYIEYTINLCDNSGVSWGQLSQGGGGAYKHPKPPPPQIRH